MDELVSMVAQKTGISADQARTAVETVISHLKSVLPEPLAGQLEGFLAGQGGAGDVAGALGNLGGLFGGDKG